FGIYALEIRVVSRGRRARFVLFGLLDVLETRSIGGDVHPGGGCIGGLDYGLPGTPCRDLHLFCAGRGPLRDRRRSVPPAVPIDPALVAESEAWLLGRLVVALGSHYFFSSSSSSTTSASTTSSSAPALESAPASSPAAAPSAPCWL